MKRAALLQDRRMQKFGDVLGRWKAGGLSMAEAGELLGVSERQFRRYRERYEEEGLEGLVDRRLGTPSRKRVPALERAQMLDLYRRTYRGWNVKHFHEHLARDHNFRWGYTWVKTELHNAGLVERAKKRGAHRRKRERKPCEGMMLHQDGSRAFWLEDKPQLDLIVTMDDATSTIYSAFLVEEEGTASTFRGLLEVFTVHGLPVSLYTDRGSHYFYTPRADGPVDKERLTQVGRALDKLGIEHIPAYSPEARGRSERMFGTLQDRLIKELATAGIDTIEAANAFIRDVYLPAHKARFAKPPALPESAFVKVADKSSLVEALCVHKACVVDRVNTVSFGAIKLQLPASPLRPHYVKANVRVHQYPDGTLAVFHGPRAIERYGADGTPLSVPTRPSLTPCSPPSRRGLETPARAAPSQCRPALTAAVRGVPSAAQVGTKKRSSGQTKKLNGSKIAIASSP